MGVVNLLQKLGAITSYGSDLAKHYRSLSIIKLFVVLYVNVFISIYILCKDKANCSNYIECQELHGQMKLST